MLAQPRVSVPHTALLPLARLRRSHMLNAERFGDPAIAAMSAMSATRAAVQTVPYSLVVHTYSNISLQASFKQNGFEPGSRIEIFASLTQSGIPLEHAAQVWVDVTQPNGGSMTITMNELEMGSSKEQWLRNWRVCTGCAFVLAGRPCRGEPFTRERTLTAAFWRGEPIPNPLDQGGTEEPRPESGECLCRLLMCLLQREGVISAELERRLKEFGINLEHARKCAEGFCRCQKAQG